MATRPREIRSSAYSRSTALAWLLDISAAARAVLLLPALARADLLLLQRRPQTGRSAGPIPHSNPQCRRAPRTACSICDSASLSQPRPRQWKARTSARSEVSCMRCRRPRRTGCTPSNPALIGGTSASVRCQSRRSSTLARDGCHRRPTNARLQSSSPRSTICRMVTLIFLPSSPVCVCGACPNRGQAGCWRPARARRLSPLAGA